MSTINTLKADNDSIIRQQVAVDSINQDEVADRLDVLADELLVRGIANVPTTAAMNTLSGNNYRLCIVANNGTFEWLASGAVDDINIFAASGGGVWSRISTSEIGTVAIVVQELDFAESIVMDISQGDWANITLTGNVESWNFLNLHVGGGLIYIKQDITGGRSILWPSEAQQPVGGLALSAGPTELTVVGWAYNGATLILSKENYGVTVFPPLHLSSFTAPDGTMIGAYVPEAGSPWVPYLENYQIIGNQARPVLTGGAIYAWCDTPIGPIQNYTLTARATLTDAAAQALIYVRFDAVAGIGVQILLIQNLIALYDLAAAGASLGVLGIAVSAVERKFTFVVHGAFIDTYVDDVLIDINRAFNAGNNGTNIRMGHANDPGGNSSFSSIRVIQL